MYASWCTSRCFRFGCPDRTRFLRKIQRVTLVQYAPLTISIQNSINSPLEGEVATRAAPRVDVGSSNSAMVEMPINMLL